VKKALRFLTVAETIKEAKLADKLIDMLGSRSGLLTERNSGRMIGFSDLWMLATA
jgi:hypothetical protein